MFCTDHSTRSVSSPPRQCAPTSLISCAENKPDFYFQRPGRIQNTSSHHTTGGYSVIGILLPSGLRFKNISLGTRCATCSPQLPPSSFDRQTPCLFNSTLIQPISGIWKDAVMSWEAAVVPSWMAVCMHAAGPGIDAVWAFWARARMLSQCSRNTNGHSWCYKENTWEKWINCVYFLTLSSPLARTFSLAYLSLPPFKHTFFFQSFLPLFDITCSSRLLHLCVPPLSLSATANLSTVVLSCNPLPSFSPVVYFPLYLYNYLSALSSRRTPCHPSICLYVKISPSAFTFILHFSFPALPYLTGLTPSSLSSFPPSFYLSSSHQLPPPACRHLSIPPPGHGLIEI